MTQIEDDERALRAALADLTAAQSRTPPDRNAWVRRRVAVTRRRRLAGAAAVVAVLAVAAIPLALPGGGTLAHRAKPPAGGNLANPPAKPPWYHITERPPGRGAPAGLVATGTLSGKRWQLDAWRAKGGLLCWRTAAGR